MASLMANAQAQLAQGIIKDVYKIFGAIIVDYEFQFYEASISRLYLTQLGSGFIPSSELLVYKLHFNKKTKFSLMNFDDRLIILKYYQKLKVVRVLMKLIILISIIIIIY